MRKILSGVGLVLHIPGIMALLSTIISLIFQETYASEAYLLTGVLSILCGQFLYRLYPGSFRKEGQVFKLNEIMAIATIGWLAAVLMAAIPYYYMAHRMPAELVMDHQIFNFKDPVNALFEALSGYTSSGLTVTISESSLPYSLQWWRSFQQWIGGVGIIVFISSFIPGISSVSKYYQDEEEEGSVLPEVAIDWTRIWWIYLLFTFVAIALYRLQGVDLWEAINHGMTGISTGGFSITDDSLKSYSSALKASSVFIMVLGSLNFSMYHLLLTQGNWKKFLKNQQHVLFFALLVSGIFLLYYENNIFDDQQSSWLDLIFQMTSALGTCGFQSADLQHWGSTALMVLTIAMLIGGPSTSTTGGLKLFRLLMVFKGSFFNATQWAYKSDVKEENPVYETALKKEKPFHLFRTLSTFLFIWIIFYVLVVYILLHNVPEQYSFMEVAFECASAFGTTGLSVNITSHELNIIAKLDIMAAMLVGRLELIPLALLFSEILRSYHRGRQ